VACCLRGSSSSGLKTKGQLVGSTERNYKTVQTIWVIDNYERRTNYITVNQVSVKGINAVKLAVYVN
jgi:hypothetical protein